MQGSRVFPGGGSWGSIPMWFRMGQPTAVDPNRQVIGWADAGYFPGCYSSFSIWCSQGPPGLQLGIMHQYTFSSELQRMSVLAQRLGAGRETHVFCKGAPETVERLCDPSTGMIAYIYIYISLDEQAVLHHYSAAIALWPTSVRCKSEGPFLEWLLLTLKYTYCTAIFIFSGCDHRLCARLSKTLRGLALHHNL